MADIFHELNQIDKKERIATLVTKITYALFILVQFPITFILVIGRDPDIYFALASEVVAIAAVILVYFKKTSTALFGMTSFFYLIFIMVPHMLDSYYVILPIIMSIFILNTYAFQEKQLQRANIIALIITLASYFISLYFAYDLPFGFIVETSLGLISFMNLFLVIRYFKTDVDDYEEKLQEVNNFLRQITDLNPHFIYAKNPDDKFIFINETMTQFYRHTSYEMIGQNVNKFYENSEILETIKYSDSEKNKRNHFLVKIMDADKEPTYHELIETPMLSENGENKGTLGVAINITTRKKAEMALQKSEQRYKRLYENHQMGIVTTIDGKFATVNDKFCAMTGYDRSEIINLNIKDIMHPEDYNDNASNTERFNQGLVQGLVFEHRFIRKDKTIGHALVHLQLLHEGAHEEIATLTDISQLKIAEQALRKSESLYRHLFDNAFDGIEIHEYKKTGGAQPHLVARNDKFRDLLGRTNEEIDEVNQVSSILNISPDLQPNGLQSSEYFLQAQKEFNTTKHTAFEWRFNHKKGHPIDVYYTLKEYNINDKIISIGIYKDITEQKKAEQIIQQNIRDLRQKNEELQKFIKSNMQLENFAYLASHDLKEPIRTIVSFSQLLKRSANDKLTETEHEYIDFVIKGSKNMSMLIEDLLNYSRVDTEDKTIKNVNMSDMLYTVNYQLSTLIENKQANIELENLPEIIAADKMQMQQLFQNLITNAIRYSTPERTPNIRISVQEHEQEWLFTVSDNGIGIKPEFFERIFLLFRKLHNEREKGTGIGLALCKKIVENHGGRIWVESEYGKGSNFYFTINKSLKIDVPSKR